MEMKAQFTFQTSTHLTKNDFQKSDIGVGLSIYAVNE